MYNQKFFWDREIGGDLYKEKDWMQIKLHPTFEESNKEVLDAKEESKKNRTRSQEDAEKTRLPFQLTGNGRRRRNSCLWHPLF